MKLTRREVQILDHLLQGKSSIKSISFSLNLKKSNITNYLKKLEKYGLIISIKSGRSMEIVLDSLPLAEFSKLRVSFSQIRFEDILVGHLPFFLSFMKGKGRFKLKDVDLPISTAKRLLAGCRSLGLVSMPKKGEYALREEAIPVAESCRAILEHMYMAEARRSLDSLDHGVFSFESARELAVIFITGKESDSPGYFPTAYTAAHKFGLNLISAGKYYYANHDPDSLDLILHILALDKGARGVIYSSYLIVKNKIDPEGLLGKRQAFGMDRAWRAGLAKFITSKGKIPFAGMDSFKEIEAMMDV